MKSIRSITLLALGMLQVAAASPTQDPAVLFGRDDPICLCGSNITCLGDKPQCVVDNKGKAICCPSGQKAINGSCVDASANLCPTGKVVCLGNTPQCTVDNKGSTICCVVGQKGINGQCRGASSHLCSDGTTICSGATPQCTVDVSVFKTSTGGASSPTVCCANNQKSLNGKCYDRYAKILPCYRGGVCDWGAGEYCAWNAGNGDSKCCKLDEYYKGTQCVKKP